MAEVEGDVDLLVIAVAAARIIGLLDDCRPGQVKAALILSSGFAETGPEGVRLFGAVIDGPLNLSFREARGETDLRLCTFTHPLAARRASLVQLVLNGSRLPGLLAEGWWLRDRCFWSACRPAGGCPLPMRRSAGSWR